MKYYAYVGHIKGVYRNWKDVKQLMMQFPFSSVRKFYTEEKAWAYVNSKSCKDYKTIHKIGFTYTEQAVLVEYFIEEKSVYVNLRFPEDFRVGFTPPSGWTYTRTTNDLHLLSYSGANIKEESAHSHVFIAQTIVDMLGPIVDINIYVECDTLYYVEKYYSGYDVAYITYQKTLQNRIGEVAYVYERSRGGQITTKDAKSWGVRCKEKRDTRRDGSIRCFEKV